MLAWLKHKLGDIVFVLQYFQVLRYIVSFVISIVLVRSALPQADLGYYEMFLFIAVSITTFWSGGIKNAMFSWYGRLSATDQSSFPKLAFIVLLFLSLVVAVFIWLFSPWFFRLFSADFLINYNAYLCIYIVLSVPLIITETVFFLRKETTNLLHYAHWSQLGLFVLTIIVAMISPSLTNFIYLLISWALVRFLYLLYIIGLPTLDITTWAKAFPFLVFSLPLMFNLLLGSAMDMIDGLFVSHFFDPSYFPVFRYGARELPLSGLLYATLSVAMIPSIVEEGASSFCISQRATKLMHYLFPFSIGMMILSPYLFPILYDQNYQSSAHIFNIYLLIISSRVLLPQSFALAFHDHKIIIWSGIIEILVNVGLSFWWMQIWGVYGLAFATVVAYFAQKLILIVYNFKKYHITLNQYIDIKYYLIYMGFLCLTFFITFNYL